MKKVSSSSQMKVKMKSQNTRINGNAGPISSKVKKVNTEEPVINLNNIINDL